MIPTHCHPILREDACGVFTEVPSPRIFGHTLGQECKWWDREVRIRRKHDHCDWIEPRLRVLKWYVIERERQVCDVERRSWTSWVYTCACAGGGIKRVWLNRSKRWPRPSEFDSLNDDDVLRTFGCSGKYRATMISVFSEFPFFRPLPANSMHQVPALHTTARSCMLYP